MLTEAPIVNNELEKTLLGICLLESNEEKEVIFNNIEAEYFYSDKNKRLFLIMKSIFNKEKRVDYVLINDNISAKSLEKIGGLEYLTSLTKYIPSTANYNYYIELIKKSYYKRDLQNYLLDIVPEISNNETDFFEILNKLSQKVDRTLLGSSDDLIPSIVYDLQDLEEYIQKVKQNPLEFFVKTNFPKLDENIIGFEKQTLTLVAARPSVGKTTFKLNLMMQALKQKKKVAFFSLEMSKRNILLKMLSYITKRNHTDLKLGINSQLELKEGETDISLVKAITFLKNCENSLWIYNEAKTTKDIYKRISKLKKEYGLDIVFIDYIQLIETDVKSSNNRHFELGKICKEIKHYSMDLDVSIVSGAQLNRLIENRQDGKPTLRDLADSGELEKDSDLILFLYPDKNESDKIHLNIGKQRTGKRDIDIDYIFHKHRNTFLEIGEN